MFPWGNIPPFICKEEQGVDVSDFRIISKYAQFCIIFVRSVFWLHSEAKNTFELTEHVEWTRS